MNQSLKSKQGLWKLVKERPKANVILTLSNVLVLIVTFHDNFFNILWDFCHLKSLIFNAFMKQPCDDFLTTSNVIIKMMKTITCFIVSCLLIKTCITHCGDAEQRTLQWFYILCLLILTLLLHVGMKYSDFATKLSSENACR